MDKKKATPFHKCNGKPSTFCSPLKRELTESGRGSWYSQNKMSDSSDVEEAMKKIIKKKFLPEDDIDWVSDDECFGDIDLIPSRFLILDISSLQSNIDKTACCRKCHSSLKLLENPSSRQGLGTK